MKKIRFILILLSLSCVNNLFSQRIEKPDKISPSDFATTNDTVNNILFQRFLVTFPFEANIVYPGAYDELFELNIESTNRFCVKKCSPDLTILLLPDIYKSEMKIRSINYYYYQNNKIETRKLKEADIHIIKNDSLYFIDFSNIIKDSLVIIDLNYSMITKIKQDIVFYIGKNQVYHDIKIVIDIPEIYSYKSLFRDKCLSVDTEDKNGQIMGYTAPAIPGCPLTSKYFADLNKRNNKNLNYYPVSYKIKSTTYTLSDNFKNLSAENNQEILNLNLFNTKIIK